MDRGERLHRTKQRLDAWLADPFGRQVLCDLVPPGKLITFAIAEDAIGDAALRAVEDSRGVPAYLAVDEPGRDALVLLVVEPAGGPGAVWMRRPGDWRPAPPTDPHAPLAELLARLREAHGERS